MNILDTRIIEIPESFVFNTIKFNKTKGSGEAKLYIGQISEKEKFNKFFTGTKIKFDKNNLMGYMFKTMLIHEYQFFGEYKNTSQEEWEKILKEINVIDESKFIINEEIETFISGNRYYIRVQNDLFKNIFRKIALPLITKLTLKLTDSNEVIFELDIKEHLEELKEKDYKNIYEIYSLNQKKYNLKENFIAYLSEVMKNQNTIKKYISALEEFNNFMTKNSIVHNKSEEKIVNNLLSKRDGWDYDESKYEIFNYQDYLKNKYQFLYEESSVEEFSVKNLETFKSLTGVKGDPLIHALSKSRGNGALSACIQRLIEFKEKYKIVNFEINENILKYEASKKIEKPHNRIVYGAPGTGKSYQLNQEVGYFSKLVKTKIKNKKSDNKSINYWVSTCGEDNDYWDDFYDKSKFAIGWGGIEDLKQFSSLSSINEKLMEIYDYGENNRTINYFKYIKTSMKKGDIIIIRKGRKNIIEGYGVVTGDYEYDISMPEDFYHTISVEWKKKETITLDEYSRNLPWATISSANDELVSLLSKNKYIEKEIETENIEYEVVDRVTFYDGYTHGQFVGTYKPVPEGDSITYKYIPGPFMKQLVESYKNPNHNFCLIIEEINRAKADRVFGNIFQLLDRDSDGKSEYHIAVSADQETYLREELEEEYGEKLDNLLNEGLYIPNNLYIWATMNSADQGVYPMDSAFKRRWHFEHIGLDDNEDQFGEEGKTFGLTYRKESETEGTKNKNILWNNFRKIINENLLGNNVSEDRLLAPFFIKENNFQMKEEESYELDEKVFKNKILMYLFDDVLRHKNKNVLFDENIKSFSQLKLKYNEGKNIFKSDLFSTED